MNIWNNKAAISRSMSVAQSDPNRPIKFSSSPAAGITVRQAAPGTFNYDEIPWYQRPIVLASMTIFMIYFFVLREENDIDRKLEVTLFENVPGLEQTQLIINYKYNMEHNKDNTAIINRMKELGIKPEDIKV